MHFGSCFKSLSILTLLAARSTGVAGSIWRKTCVVEASGTNSTDDAPAIVKAFDECKTHGKVVFQPTTYYVNSAMNISGLYDVEVDWRGTLLVSR